MTWMTKKLHRHILICFLDGIAMGNYSASHTKGIYYVCSIFGDIFCPNFDYVITNSDRHPDRHVQIPTLLKVVVTG